MTSPQPKPVVVGFPLVGPGRAGNSPADGVPSHGTSYFAQDYAIDFFRADQEGNPTTASALRGFFARTSATEYFCWDAPVLAASDGTIVDVGDAWPDRIAFNVLAEVIRATLSPPTPTRSDIRSLVGNYVLLESSSGVQMYAHLRNGSICVRPGERIARGQVLGRVGNSGNTTMPHLHFQMMDNDDPFQARGLPIAFDNLEVERDGEWLRPGPFVPKAEDRFRTFGESSSD